MRLTYLCGRPECWHVFETAMPSSQVLCFFTWMCACGWVNMTRRRLGLDGGSTSSRFPRRTD